jgi:hypothetical protein
MFKLLRIELQTQFDVDAKQYALASEFCNTPFSNQTQYWRCAKVEALLRTSTQRRTKKPLDWHFEH